MDWKDIAATVGKTAPLLGTLLGGPAGAALAAAGALAAHALGTEPTASAVAAAVATDPAAAVKLRQIELDNATQLQALAVQAEANRLAADTAALQTAAADRADARKLQTATASRWPGVLTGVTTAAVLGLIAVRMAGVSMPQDPTTVQLIGSLSTGWGMGLAYFLGTTRNSGRKDELLAQSTPAGG